MRFLTGILLLGVVSSLGSITYAQTAPDPKARMEAAAGQLFSITAEDSASESVDRAFVESETQRILSDIVDYDSITRGVYGKSHRDKLSDDQKQRFKKEFEISVVQLVSKALMGIGPTETIVHNASSLTETRAQIPVVLTTTNRETYEFQFSLGLSEGDWRVRNIVVNGVNLGLTYRNQFSELMKTHNEEIDAVILAWSQTVVDQAPN